MAPAGPVFRWLPSCGTAEADTSNPDWRDPNYLNCSDTFWGCTEGGQVGNAATPEDPYCETCTHAWDVGDDWDAFVQGYEAGYAEGFEETLSQDTTEDEAKDKCYKRAADNFASAALLGGTGTVLSITGFGATAGTVLILWGAAEGIEGSLIYFYCRFTYD